MFAKLKTQTDPPNQSSVVTEVVSTVLSTYNLSEITDQTVGTQTLESLFKKAQSFRKVKRKSHAHKSWVNLRKIFMTELCGAVRHSRVSPHSDRLRLIEKIKNKLRTRVLLVLPPVITCLIRKKKKNSPDWFPSLLILEWRLCSTGNIFLSTFGDVFPKGLHLVHHLWHFSCFFLFALVELMDLVLKFWEHRIYRCWLRLRMHAAPFGLQHAWIRRRGYLVSVCLCPPSLSSSCPPHL